MIPYFMRLKEGSLKWCILCKQLCNKGQTVLVYGNINTPLATSRYLHTWCIIKYSLKQRLKRRLNNNGRKTKEDIFNTN